MRMKNIAIITARGGSKRIPKKNIREFCGKPIIAYSIEAAIKSGVFDEVMVSTDSEEIAGIAREYGASVPFMRSEKTSGDFATTADVLMEVLTMYKMQGQEFDVMACIYPTAPFVTADKLRNGVQRLCASDACMAMPVVAFSYPPQRSYVVNQNLLNMKWPENYEKRSQDLETLYHDSGQFYITKMDSFWEHNGVITSGIMPIIVSEFEVQDIDNEVDWKLAEMKYQLMVKQNEC